MSDIYDDAQDVGLSEQQRRLVNEYFADPDLSKKNAFFRAGYKCSNPEHLDTRVARAFDAPAVKQEIARRRADALSQRKVSPLDVMLENMEYFYDIAKKADPNDKGGLQARQIAQACAKEAAPYVHPRLTAIAVKRVFDPGSMSDDELAAAILEIRSQLPAAGSTGGAGGRALAPPSDDQD